MTPFDTISLSRCLWVNEYAVYMKIKLKIKVNRKELSAEVCSLAVTNETLTLCFIFFQEQQKIVLSNGVTIFFLIQLF